MTTRADGTLHDWPRPLSASQLPPRIAGPRAPGPRLPGPRYCPEHQQLWLRIESRTWRTLAIVPAEEGISTYDVASLIMSIGVYCGESIGLFDFRDVMLKRVLGVIEDACAQMNQGERLIFATRSIKDNLATIPLLRAIDGVVLCVALGSTPIRRIEETIEQIGKDRLLGSIVVREPEPRASAPRPSAWRRLVRAPW
jgi:hypothetical protein